MMKRHSQLKILVLEDEAYRRELIEPIIEGHQIYWASNADEALAVLENERFDLILLDHDLSARTCGCQVASRLAQRECLNHNTKVVVHSINPNGIKRMMRLLNNLPLRIPVFSLPEVLPELLLSLPVAA
ncbi:MAG: cyclic-phosphate processing receiver domain-containing protein [Acidobacteriota bacterium]